MRQYRMPIACNREQTSVLLRFSFSNSWPRSSTVTMALCSASAATDLLPAMS